MTNEKNINTLFNEFDNYIQKHKYSNHSFVTTLENFNVNKENLKNWSIQKYHQVYQQNCNFSAIHSVAGLYEDIRQYQMKQLIAEETAIADGTDSHYGLMKRFALSIGATESEINTAKPGQPINDFFHFQYNHCKNSPIYGMLSIYLVESQTSESVNKMYKAIKKQFGTSDYDLEWFTVHSTVEDSHADEAKELIVKYAKDDSHFAEKGWQVIKDGIQAWNKLQDYYATILQAIN
jgi:pyrroloquinoline-quinone synthase